MNENKVLLFNTLHSKDENLFDGIRCWVPKSEDARVAINYLKNKSNKEIFVENVLSNYTNSNEYSFVSINPLATSNKKIILYAQSDTLADSCSKIFEELLKLNVEVKLVVPRFSKEKADVFFQNAQLPFDYFSVKLLKTFSPDVFLVLNDWTKEVHRIFSYCKQLHIPLVCLQESIIDFGDQKMKRMQFADDVLVQGVQTLSELHRERYYITGNPRYIADTANNPGKTVLVNCNFTYNVFEHERENWLSGIKIVLDEQSIPFQIVQHPRDIGEINQYGIVVKTNSQTLLPLIKTSKFAVTRFSSLVHEALAQNVPVVYYNPHGEEMKYDFGFNNTFLRYAKTKDELREAVMFLNSYIPDKEEIASYLSVHCIPKEGSAAKNIAFLLANNRFSTSRMKVKDWMYRMLYYPTFLKLIQQIKRLLP